MSWAAVAVSVGRFVVNRLIMFSVGVLVRVPASVVLGGVADLDVVVAPAGANDLRIANRVGVELGVVFVALNQDSRGSNTTGSRFSLL